jgi:ribonuclease J
MTHKIKDMSSVSIIPLGGVGEIGKNCFIIECEDEILLIDAGIMFPYENHYGVNVIIPNFEYLVERHDRVKGIIITHGHEDHMGALPYLFREIDTKIYTTKLTSGLIRNKFEDIPSRHKPYFETLKAGDTFTVGNCFEVSTASLSHSIPAGIGLRIATPGGVIVHSGDFKIDETPIDDEKTDLDTFSKWGQDGVDILMVDTTNVYKQGRTPSEKTIGVAFEDIIRRSPGRVFIALFASHFHRMQQAIDVAEASGRQVVMLGRSMALNTRTAYEMGYLRIPDGILVEPDDMANYSDRELLILATGSQGEPMSALARMAARAHPVSLKEGDVIVISANPIPGNEVVVGRIINRVLELGAAVITSDTERVHVSGHASKEEIRIFVDTVNPQFMMPYHGEYRQFVEFRNLISQSGRKPGNVILTSVGDKVRFWNNEISVQKGVTGGEQLVRGDIVEDEWLYLADERTKMASGGVLLALVYISQRKKKILDIKFNARGFVNTTEWYHMFEKAQTSLIDSLNTLNLYEKADFSEIKERAEQKLSRLILRYTGLRPLVIVEIIEV